MKILNEEMNLGQNSSDKITSNGSNVPEKKFQIGGISATVWQNSGKNKAGEDISYRSVTFTRNYKDKDGSWKNTNSLRTNDLPKASLVINKAYEYISMNA